MEMDDLLRTHALIRQHEGYRRFLYKDTAGIATVGVGRNLEARGISSLEADLMLNNDLHDAIVYLSKFPWFLTLAAPRQAALIDMAFNLGATRFEEFHQMLAHLAAGEWKAAACAMVQSEWANQVGMRVENDAAMIETGEWPK